MFDNSIRNITPQFLSPIAKVVPKRVTANQLTLLGFLVAIFCLIALAYGKVGIALALFILNRILDGLDGYIARQREQQSQYGHIYDITADFFLYSSLPIAIAFANDSQKSALIAAIMIATYYINAGIWMSISKVTDPQSRGLIEGFETIIFYVILISMPKHFDIIGIVFASLVAMTAVIRLAKLMTTKQN